MDGRRQAHTEPAATGGVGNRQVLGTYPHYAEAQRAVDFLSDEGFPVERVTIVGEGLQYVERVTGRRGFGRAAGEGAANGAVIGALLGFLFGIFSLVDPLVSGIVLALWGIVIGAILGAILGAIAQGMTGGTRDFSSASGFEASRYQVLVDDEVAEQARQLLDRLPPRVER